MAINKRFQIKHAAGKKRAKDIRKCTKNTFWRRRN